MNYTLFKALVLAALIVYVYPNTCLGNELIAICESCTVDIAKCDTTGCKDGYYYDATATIGCSKCHPACDECSGPGETKCVDCKPGYYLDAGKCVSCDPSCAVCTGAGSTKCSRCNDGYYPLSATSCTACTVNGCKLCTEANKCVVCKEDHTINEAKTECAYTGTSFGSYIFCGIGILLSLLIFI